MSPKLVILILLFVGIQPTVSCQTSTQKTSNAEKAKQYYDDGVACYKNLDFICSTTYLEQVWYLKEYSGIDLNEWAFYTAQSNYMVAIDEDIRLGLDTKIQAAERADFLYKRFGNEFVDNQMVLQYFIVRELNDTCDGRKIAAIQRFDEAAAMTELSEFKQLKKAFLDLLNEGVECEADQPSEPVE